MKRAAEVAVAAREEPGYRLALRDVHSALLLDQLSRSDDAFVFAYRSLVDLTRGFTGRFSGDVTAGDWTSSPNISR